MIHKARWPTVLVVLVLLAAAPGGSTGAGFARRGFYLHGCWVFNYPFAVRCWQPADYAHMFGLLRRLGFNTVMLWPVLETIPAPLSPADRAALANYRQTIADAQAAGLECWLTQCPNLTVPPELGAKPWAARSLMRYARNVRLDRPEEAEPFYRHRAAILEILNNADGYVTIDGDPGGYPGARPAEFLEVFRRDRQTIDRAGTHPKTQKVIPWIWCGWGTKGVWREPIEPFVRATLATLKPRPLEPFELLPGRSIREGHANGRINMDLVSQAGLLDRSTLMLYEIIEFEPSVPSARLQLADVRRVIREELTRSSAARGCFGNAQQPVMVLPNLYLFGRGAQDPAYLDQPDEKVLGDLARLLGGPPELLVPAWSCLGLPLERIPGDLPARLRSTRLSGAAAADLPGGPERYLEILACHADAQIRLLNACRQPAGTRSEAARAIADATGALVGWWRVHRYVFDGEGREPFAWRFVPGSQLAVLRQWCRRNRSAALDAAEEAAQQIASRGILPAPEASQRVQELFR